MSGRALPPSSAFAGDDGACDPLLARALEAYGVDGSPARVVEALATVRVLTAFLANREPVAGEASADRPGRAAEASAGVVAVRAPDGRTAMPVFSSVGTMRAWHPDARPVPVRGADAAVAARDEHWDLLVVDPGGPVTVQVPRTAVVALAEARSWRPVVLTGAGPRSVDAEVQAAIRRVVVAVAHVRGAEVLPGVRAEVRVVVLLEPGLDRAALDHAVAAINAAVAADETVAERVDSVELTLRSDV